MSFIVPEIKRIPDCIEPFQIQSYKEKLRGILIEPESDHWECLSVTDSLTNSHLVSLIDVTLACHDDNSKLVEVVTVAHVDDDNSLVQIWKVKFGHKVKFLFRL